MTHREFIGKLSIYYKEQMLDGASIPNIRIEENLNWARRNVKEAHLADLWACIITQFKPTMTVPYPLINDLMEIYSTMPSEDTPSGFKQAALDRGETMTPADISKTVVRLRSKDTPSMAEVDFIDAWETLAYHWGRVMDETKDEYRAHQYCDEVKRGLLRGDKVEPGETAFNKVAEIFGKEDTRRG